MERDLLFALHETKGIGSVTIAKLLAGLQPFSQLRHASEHDLFSCGVDQRKAAAIMQGIQSDAIKQAKLRYQERNIHWVTIFDELYPKILRQTADPPWVLYYKGDPALFKIDRQIAIVGTRTPTAYGRKIAMSIAKELSAHSFCVVSGLARGIDAYAHLGALEQGNGGTIAVLGTGIDQIYPAENKNLFTQIEQKGLIISEYPLGTPARAGMFPRRNRIIAGLSLGTLVIEAAERSGSLITADLALEESRDVFAVPGPITSQQSRGTLALIREGAKLTMSAEDVISEYGYRGTWTQQQKGIDQRSETLNHDEQKILTFLSASPVSFDEIMAFTKFDFGHLHSLLLSLLMKKRIEQLPGSLYISL